MYKGQKVWVHNERNGRFPATVALVSPNQQSLALTFEAMLGLRLSKNRSALTVGLALSLVENNKYEDVFCGDTWFVDADHIQTETTQ